MATPAAGVDGDGGSFVAVAEVVALAPVVVALAPVVAEPVGVIDEAGDGEVMLSWSGAEQATVVDASPVRATTTAR